MPWKSFFAWMILACGLSLGFASGGRAQESAAGKVVYGMFGPRVLGQTLQSPVQRPDRGIARDAYGNFLGVNRAYSGRRFPEPGVRSVAPEPRPIFREPETPREPEIPPERPSRPDEWLRTEGGEAEASPPPWRMDEGGSDSASLDRGGTGSRFSGARNVMVSLPSDVTAADPLAGRIARLLERMPQIMKRSPIRVTVVGETAILRGRVASNHDRELAENLVRLEPGIWEVRNELLVEESPRVAAAPATGSGRP